MMSDVKYSAFVARAKRGIEFWTRISIRDFTHDLLEKMSELNMNNAALAKAAGVSPAYVTKVMRGSENFTLQTMTKLARAVGGKVRIHIAPSDVQTDWIDRPSPTPVTVGEKPNYKIALYSTPASRATIVARAT
jgi:transcriptional regulator with XRE-family HTH domain